MMTANEAREMANGAYSCIEQELLKELLCKAEKAIKEASLSGKTCCYINIACYTNETVRKAVKFLKSFGYKCDTLYELSLNNCLEIKW